MVGACSRLEVGYYMKDFEYALESINAYGNKDVEMEMSKTERGEKKTSKAGTSWERTNPLLKFYGNRYFKW